MPVVSSGTKAVGVLRRVSTSDEIDLGALYAVEGYLRPISNFTDSMLQRGVNALVGLDSPLDVTFAEVQPDGHILIQGRAAHNSPVLILASAAVLVLAGIGIALAVGNIYTVTDAVVAGGRLPGGAPGDSASGGGLIPDVGLVWPVILLAIGVFIWWKFIR